LIRRYLRRIELQIGNVFGRPSGLPPMVQYVGIELDSEEEPDLDFLARNALEPAAGLTDAQLRASGVDGWEYMAMGDTRWN